MRLSCPGCQTEYEVPDAALAGRVRTLRCANCSHQWEYGPLAVAAAAIDPAAAAWPGAAPRSVFSDMPKPVEPPPPPRATPATDKYEPLEPPTPRGAWPPPPEPVSSRYEPLTASLAEPVTDTTEIADEPATSPPADLPLPATPQSEAAAAAQAKTATGNEERFAALVKTSRNEPDTQTGPSARAGIFTTLILLIGIGAGIWAARFHIMQAWPPSTRLFDAINTIIASFTAHH